MTKGRTALSLNLVVPPTIPMDVVHPSTCRKQVEVLGMTKGWVGVPIDISVARILGAVQVGVDLADIRVYPGLQRRRLLIAGLGQLAHAREISRVTIGVKRLQ